MIIMLKGNFYMLMKQLEQITDPRSYHGREYLHNHILYFTILAILSNAKTYSDVASFIKVHFEQLKVHFGLKWRHAPDVSAIRKIIVALDPQEVEAIFRADAEHLAFQSSNKSNGQEVQQICFDGKILRGSFSSSKSKRAQGVFSAFAVHNQLVLAHMPLGDNKEHEIGAFQKFLLSLNLKGVIVTADAMHCQKKHLNARS